MASINRQILRLAIPAIISNITVPLLGLCDTTIAGHLGSNLYLGSIAVGTMAINTLMWPLGFLRMGTTGLTAQACGEQDKTKTEKVFTQALVLALIIGIVLLCLQSPLRQLIVGIMAQDGEIRNLASTYFNICISGLPAMLGTMAVSGWLLGMQTSVYPMAIAITSNVINILLSCLFVFGLDMGFKGIALGTMIANWAGFFLALYFAARLNKGKVPLCRIKETFRHGDTSKFFKVNSDIFLRSLCIMTVTISVTAIGERLGPEVLAANAVMMQFFTLFSHFMDGFAFSAEALSGKSLGENNRNRLRAVSKGVLKWGGYVAAIFTIIYATGITDIAALITNDADVLANVAQYKIWVILIPLITVCAFVFDGFYIGLTATRRMLLATLSAAIIFFIVNFLNIADGEVWRLNISLPDNNRLWCGFLSYLLARGVILGVLYPSTIRRKLQGKTSADSTCKCKIKR